jgi:hypothetical protein
VKFSFRQILASASGAVLAAVIASFFGVKGTMVGVAIGSAAATSGTALVAQSIERGHKKMQQVVRVPDRSVLLRRIGFTGTSGDADVTTAPAHAAEVAPVVEPVTAEAAEPTTPGPEEATTGSLVDDEKSRRIRLHVIVGITAGVFVLSLMLVTGVELIAGRPLADLFGGHVKGGGTTVQQIISPPAPTTTLPPPTTTTSSTSTTTTTSSTTTTSTTPGETTTSSTAVGDTTTTNGLDTTTTTAPLG